MKQELTPATRQDLLSDIDILRKQMADYRARIDKAHKSLGGLSAHESDKLLNRIQRWYEKIDSLAAIQKARLDILSMDAKNVADNRIS